MTGWKGIILRAGNQERVIRVPVAGARTSHQRLQAQISDQAAQQQSTNQDKAVIAVGF